MMDIDIIDEETLNTNIEDEEVLELDVTVEDNTEDISTTLSNDFLKGEKGEKGEKGDTYTITSGDYQEIANVVETDIQPTLNNKVDKVTGKGLSTNDFTTEEKAKLSSLDNYDDTEVRQLIEGKQPKGNYLTEETDPTVPNHVKSITQNNITSWNNKANASDIPTKTSDLTNDSDFATNSDVSTAVSNAITTETTARQNGDNVLQNQIDAITSASDVVDVVSTYADLQNYDTTKLTSEDVIKVMQDSTHNEAISYYRWIVTSNIGSWTYVGSEGPFYTKGETHILLNAKENTSNKVTGLSNSSTDTQYPSAKCVYDSQEAQDKEIEKLQIENVKLKAAIPSTTGTGKEVILDKTLELNFVKPPLPRGNTEQESTTGKNLLNTLDAATTTTNGITYYREQGVYYLSGNNTKTDAVWVLPNTQNTNLPEFEIGQTYTMSFKGDIPDNIYIQLNAVKSDTGTQYNLGSLRKTVPSVTFTIDNNYLRSAQLFVGVLATATVVNGNFFIQIEKGSSATSYEPYTGGQLSPSPDYPQEVKNVTGNVEVIISNKNNTESKILPVSLGNIELCKIGDYQDYFYKENDKWYKYNAIEKMILNGSENWGLQSINSYGIANFQKNPVVDTILGQANLSFNDTFSPQTSLIGVTKDIGYFLNTSRVLFIRFDSTIANTAAKFKEWLSQHNVTLYYASGTPTSTEITDTTLISQLEEISNTLSYKEQTNITSNTIALFDVEAYQDLKTILDEKYTKPSTGIPKTDLISSVQTSLGKADTALQSYTETDPTVPSYVKNITQANITNWNNKADTGDIPTKLSDLIDDSTHRLVTDTEKTAWNSKQNEISDLSSIRSGANAGATAVQPGDLSTVATSGNYSDLSNKPYYYGTCATGASTRLKVVECEGFVLEEGATISVTFTNAQTYNGSPQLNVNGTGAIIVQYKQGTSGIRYMWSAGEIIDFTYNGEYWVCHGRALATTTYYGVAKLSASAVSTSTSLALTPSVINATMENIVTGYDAYSTSATYEVGDRVRYSTHVYECIEAIPVKEAWTVAHWKIVDPLQKQIDDLEARIKALENLS